MSSSPSEAARGPGSAPVSDHVALAVLSSLLADRELDGMAVVRRLAVQILPTIRETLHEWEALGRVKRLKEEKGQPVRYLATAPASELARLAVQAASRIEWAEREKKAKRGGQSKAVEQVEQPQAGQGEGGEL